MAEYNFGLARRHLDIVYDTEYESLTDSQAYERQMLISKCFDIASDYSDELGFDNIMVIKSA